MNPFGTTARAIGLQGDHLLVTGRSMPASVSLPEIGEAPALLKGALGTTLSLQSTRQSNVILRGAGYVQPIYDVLPIAPATYYEHLARRTDPARLSDCARRDVELRPPIPRVFDANWQVYGVRKVWRQLRREGFDVARCTVASLMKRMGIQGIIRRKPHKTTIPGKKLPRPLD